MTLKSATAKILQITGLITAITGLVKSLIDLIEAGTPHFMMVKTTARIGGPHPPPPPPVPFYDEYMFIIGPVLIMVGLVVMGISQKMRKHQ